jgi:membrane-associated phospholipid phosphatase
MKESLIFSCMAENDTLIRRLAQAISFLGHPLIVSVVFIYILAFHFLEAEKAALITAVFTAIIVIPVVIRNYGKVKKGEYTNFDISVREQRGSFYPFLFSLLLGTTGILFLTSQPRALSFGFLFFTAMIGASYIINTKIKCSLHTSILVYFALSLLLLSPAAGICTLILAVLIGYSRIVLKRHSLTEVITGAAIGLVFGGMTYFFFTGR